MQPASRPEKVINRKKIILGPRQIPQPSSHNMIWVVNKDGNTFLPLQQNCYSDDAEIASLCTQKLIPKINKKSAFMWSKTQIICGKSQIFEMTRFCIKIILPILIAALLAILFQKNTQTSYNILIFLLFFVFMTCGGVSFYIFSKNFKSVNHDITMINGVITMLREFNKIHLFRKGLAFKCDPGVTWICLAPYKNEQLPQQVPLNQELLTHEFCFTTPQ